MIYIPRFEDVIMRPPAQRTGVGGVISLAKGKNLGYMDADAGVWVPGKDVVTGQVEPFHNIITNTGLDALAANRLSVISQYCHVGTGTTTETAADTALVTPLAYKSGAATTSDSVQASAPYYSYNDRRWRFDEGAAEGNIAEIGFNSSASNTNMFSRARVKDTSSPQTPTTITVLSDEWLDVSYQVRLYPDHINSNGTTNDGSGSIDISGATVGYTIRPAYVNNSSYWHGAAIEAIAENTIPWAVYGTDAALGAVTSTMTATLSDGISSGYFNNAYTTSTYNRTVGCVIALDDGNLTGGINGVLARTYMGSYQILFGSTIAKDATKILTLNLDLSWTRASI